MSKTVFLSFLALMMFAPVTVWAAAPNMDKVLVADPAQQPTPLPVYWLGIECRLPPPPLKAQLNLPDDQGMVVEAVAPDSPAGKAGLAQYDVILNADQKKITNISDLQQAVKAAKDKPMKLAIIREGQTKTIEITPEKRPDSARFQPPPPPESDFEYFKQWFEHHGPGSMGRAGGMVSGGQMRRGGPMQFNFFRPGVILPPGAPIGAPLPGNMSITITKSGDKPADITVTRDKEKWQITEKDMDKLPPDVQPFVHQMLGAPMGPMPGPGGKFKPEIVLPPPQAGQPGAMPPPYQQPPQFGAMGPPPQMPDLGKRFEKRLEEMSRRIEDMARRMEELSGREFHKWEHRKMMPPKQNPPPPQHEPPEQEEGNL